MQGLVWWTCACAGECMPCLCACLCVCAGSGVAWLGMLYSNVRPSAVFSGSIILPTLLPLVHTVKQALYSLLCRAFPNPSSVIEMRRGLLLDGPDDRGVHNGLGNEHHLLGADLLHLSVRRQLRRLLAGLARQPGQWNRYALPTLLLSACR